MKNRIKLKDNERVAAMNDTVLIVEDDKNTANLVSLYLKKEGFETIIAHDGRQAIELARHSIPFLSYST